MSALCHRAEIFSVSLLRKPPYTTYCNVFFRVLDLQTSLNHSARSGVVWMGKHSSTVEFSEHSIWMFLQVRPTWKLLTALSRHVTVPCLARYCCTSNNWQDGALSCRRTHFLATYILKMFQVKCLLQTGKHLFLPLPVDCSTLRNNKVMYTALSLEKIFCHLPFQVKLMELHDSKQEW
jgi:hypothetical protein